MRSTGRGASSFLHDFHREEKGMPVTSEVDRLLMTRDLTPSLRLLPPPCFRPVSSPPGIQMPCSHSNYEEATYRPRGRRSRDSTEFPRMQQMPSGAIERTGTSSPIYTSAGLSHLACPANNRHRFPRLLVFQRLTTIKDKGGPSDISFD